MVAGLVIAGSRLKLWGEELDGEEESDSQEENEGHADSGLAVDFGDEVGGGDVDGDSGGEWQTDFDPSGQ